MHTMKIQAWYMQSISVWPLSWKGGRALSSATTARSSAEITAHLCRHHGDSVARVETPNFAFESGNVSFCWTFDFSQIGLIIQLTHFRRGFWDEKNFSFFYKVAKETKSYTHTLPHPLLFLLFYIYLLSFNVLEIHSANNHPIVFLSLFVLYNEIYFLASLSCIPTFLLEIEILKVNKWRYVRRLSQYMIQRITSDSCLNSS